MKTIGLLLAGGRGSRMGAAQPKPLLRIGGRTIAERVLDRFHPHVEDIVISTDQPDAYAHLGWPTVQDRFPGHRGPLAGLDAAAYAHSASYGTDLRIISLPGDTPFLPVSLIATLMESGATGMTAVASWNERLQPTCALWPAEALLEFGALLGASGRSPSLRSVIERRPFVAVPFPSEHGVPDGDPFFNVNTPHDLDRARRHAEHGED